MSMAPASGTHDAQSAESWKGSGRYEVLRCLGRGGMGVVYEVFDRERRQLVALKTLPRFDADALYRFKQEFRTLAGVHHRNLVHLYELVASEEGEIFFTMELVNGRAFSAFVRGYAGQSGAPGAVATLVEGSGERDTLRPGARESATPAPRVCPANLDRLRPALRQLARGVQAIHSAGRLHRDLKPSNVLVTREGRVVILDFGVATELRDMDRAAPVGTGETVGTARYMAPEQVGGDEAPNPASDWYSVGVMLYEALVGRAPFLGSMNDVLRLKNTIDPLRPSACVEGAPEDLDALCMAMLRRDPAERPSGEEILRRLDASQSSAPPAAFGEVQGGTAFIGRESQLRTLREAFDAARAGRATTVRIGGPPGMGKSTIVHRFLDDIVRGSEALVLRGRAYEREEVPYKAVDTIIDAVSRHWLRLVEEGDRLDLPADIGVLAQMFPVLQRVPTVAGVLQPPVGDPQAFRRRAFSALRTLFASLANRQPLVLFVDDAQWGDVDSAALLLDVLRPPAAPPLLLLMTHRDGDEAAASPFLRELRDRWPERADAVDVVVGPLETEDSRRLALTLLESSDELAQRTARAVARESRGSPFLIEELVRSNRGTPADAGATLAVVTLEQMVGQRLERVSADVRRFTEMVAVAGRPIPVTVVAAASGVEETVNELVAFACSRRFARTGLRNGREVIEPIHDRVRETIVSLLPGPTLRAHHERLATVLEQRAGADPDAIASHLIEAGLLERAAPFACLAAEQAYGAMAYERAARLYARAVELLTSPTAKLAMKARQAEALASAGRVEEAAPAFLDVASQTEPVQALDLRRQAAEQFVMAANFDAANEALGQVLASVGMRMPSSRVQLVVMLLVFRALLWMRGTRFVLRDEETVSKAALVRLDTCSAVARVFSVTDPILGAYFQARFLLLALRSGEAFRLVYALLLEGAYRAVRGVAAREHAERAFEDAAMVVRVSGNARAERIVSEAMRGFAAVVQGRDEEALDLSDRAAVKIQGLGPGLYWALRATQLNALWALGDLGELREQSTRLTRAVHEAIACGDVWTATTLRASSSFTAAWLGGHEPDEIRGWIEAGVSKWTRRVYHNQHLFACWALAFLDLYDGRGREAFERVDREFPRARRALKFRLEVVHVEARALRARAALLAAVQAAGDERTRLVGVARGDARWFRRKGPPHTRHLAAIIEAEIADLQGERQRCIAALREAIAGADAAPARHVAAAARIRLGGVLGEEGRGMVESGKKFMHAQGVADAVRLAAVYVPGLRAKWARK
jgi:hypothetical protein